jgi:hypothetical protein
VCAALPPVGTTVPAVDVSSGLACPVASNDAATCTKMVAVGALGVAPGASLVFNPQRMSQGTAACVLPMTIGGVATMFVVSPNDPAKCAPVPVSGTVPPIKTTAGTVCPNVTTAASASQCTNIGDVTLL